MMPQAIAGCKRKPRAPHPQELRHTPGLLIQPNVEGGLMKSLLVVFVAFLGFGYAQQGEANRGGAGAKPPEKQAEKQPDKQPEKQTDKPEKTLVRRLEAVTWNPVRAELTWLVSVWSVQSGDRSLVAKERYTMHPDDAVMESDGEFRKFDADEAKRLRVLMDVISTYAVESTVWWDYGPDAKTETQIVPAPDGDSNSKGGADRNKTEKDTDKDKKIEKNKDSDEAPKSAPKAAPPLLVGPKAELIH
jgi:hypothetical protein